MKEYNYIYLIRNLINNKIYIGKHSTNNINDYYMGSGKILKLAFKKEGKKNFKKTILCFCDEDQLGDMEKQYIKIYNSTDPKIGYNITEGGEGNALFGSNNGMYGKSKERSGKNNPMYGRHHTEEAKAKMRANRRKKTQCDDFKS